MKFDEENNKSFSLATFSKSFGDTFKQCPLKAWFTARNRDKASKNSSKPLEIGKYTHELFAQAISEKYLKKDYVINNKGIDPSVVYESKVMMNRVNFDSIIEVDDEVIAVEDFHKVYMENGLELIGIFDLVLLKNGTNSPYIQVFDLKTGFKLEKEVDLQCMIYVYLAAVIYPGLPILFTTYSARTGDTWGKYFREHEALALKDIILDFSSEVKEEVDSEYMPIAKCSDKCLNCPFLDECSAGQVTEETNIQELMNAYQMHKVKAKYYENKLKEFRKNSKEDTAVSSGTGFVVDYSETYSTSIATTKTTKDDLKVLLANSKGGLKEVLDSIELKLTDKVVAKGKELGVEFKPKITKRLVIKESSSEDEGEE